MSSVRSFDPEQLGDGGAERGCKPECEQDEFFGSLPFFPVGLRQTADYLAAYKRYTRQCAQLAAPIIVFSLVFNIATGLVGRVMPQFQVFFVATPLSVMLGMSILAISIGLIGMVWVSRYRDLLAIFT